MEDPERALGTLREIDALGVQISIDDFGTGFSSLAYLTKLPVDELKIDRAFVMNMLEDKDDFTIVRSTIELAHNLGLRVVAEGVESEQAMIALTNSGCDMAQGFYASKPVPVDVLERWLAQSRWGLAAGTPVPAGAA
jgi:EAL domain-containing protein (putative c-di-GMP-specific phosphodiesterase class I)